MFTNAKITVTPVSNEVDVKSTLAKVQLGEVDAGVVYVTDVRSAGSKVTGIPIDRRRQRLHRVPDRDPHPRTERRVAQAFVDYVLSAAGSAVLTQDGFAAP